MSGSPIHAGYQPDDSPLEDGSLEFDLSPEATEEQHALRSSVGPFAAVYTGGAGIFALLGLLGILGVFDAFSGTLGAALVIIGGLIFCLGIYWILTLGSAAATRLRVDDGGLTFTKKRGKPLQLMWDDPRLKVNLSHLYGNPDKVLPTSDARRVRPYWIDVWGSGSRFVKLETTLPREAMDSITERAQKKPLQVSITQVAFYWQSAPKSPGWLSWDEETGVQNGRVLNGEIRKLRGPLARPDV